MFKKKINFKGRWELGVKFCVILLLYSKIFKILYIKKTLLKEHKSR